MTSAAVPRSPADGFRSVARASGIYYVSHALLVVAGVISMPITTRLLSREQYGLLSLAFATIAVLTLVAGLGLGSAAMRLYHDARRKGSQALRHACEGWITAALAGSGTAATMLVIVVTSTTDVAADPYAQCLVAGSGLMVVRAVTSVVAQIDRARERAGIHAATLVGVRYATLIAVILSLWFGPRLAVTVLAASIAVEAAALAVRLRSLQRAGLFTRPRLPRELDLALRYGLPLAAAGSARFLLAYGDRFVIERFHGLDAVARYTVPCDLLGKLGELVAVPMQLAAVPVLFRLWSESGADATSRAASQTLATTASLLVPVAVLYALFAEDLVVTVASAKYAGAGELTPYILPGIIFSCCNFVVVAGMTIRKRTVQVARNVAVAALINVLLNFLLVPSGGLAGAGLATSLAWLVLIVANARGALDTLQLAFPWRPIGRAFVAVLTPVAAAAALGALDPASPVALVATVGGLAGATLALLLLLDPSLRVILRSLWPGRLA